MVWADIPAAQQIQLEASQDMLAGTPVYVSGNLLYPASYETNPHVVGVLKADVLATFIGAVVTGGPMDLAGLTAGVPYFLGVGIITQVPPITGYLVRIGVAVTSGKLVVGIQEPILLT
jgi:hypothetical protein